MFEQLPAFCSLRSQEAAEQPFGTASTGDAWLLLEYARPWGAKAFSESALPEAVKTHLSGVLKSWLRAAGFATMLTALYGVLYILLKSENNALLMGSLLLFGILAAIMWVTRKVDWYALGTELR